MQTETHINDRTKYLGASCFVLGMLAATKKPSERLLLMAKLSRDGTTGGFFSPTHAWVVFEFAREHGFKEQP